MISNFKRENGRVYFNIDPKYVGKAISTKINDDDLIFICIVPIDGIANIIESVFNKFKHKLYLEGELLSFSNIKEQL
jgi:hypothetical protein